MSQDWNEQFNNYKNRYIDCAFVEKESEFKKLITQKGFEGIVDFESYNKANYKILFIAHEPYCKTEQELSIYKETGLIGAIKTFGSNPKGNSALSYNAKMTKELLGFQNVENALNSVAWINLKKYPRLKTSKENAKEIQWATVLNYSDIFNQIEEIKPQIIIAESIFEGRYSLWNHWSSLREEIKFFYIGRYSENIDSLYEPKSKTIIFDIPHPTARGKYRFNESIISYMKECLKAINSDSFTLLDEWVSRRKRCKQ